MIKIMGNAKGIAPMREFIKQLLEDFRQPHTALVEGTLPTQPSIFPSFKDITLHGLIERARQWEPEPLYRLLLGAIIKAIYRPTVIGLENIPTTGPAVLIANHVSYLDGPILSALCKRPVRYVIDKNIYEQPGINYFMRHNKAIPIQPKKEVVEAALNAISDGLKQGDLICIFPEGRLTYTGQLGRFKPGIEYMIQRDPVPVIPIALEGLWGSIFSRKYMNARFRFLPRSIFPDVRVVIGYAIPPEQVKLEKLQKVVLKLLERARAL